MNQVTGTCAQEDTLCAMFAVHNARLVSAGNMYVGANKDRAFVPAEKYKEGKFVLEETLLSTVE